MRARYAQDPGVDYDPPYALLSEGILTMPPKARSMRQRPRRRKPAMNFHYEPPTARRAHLTYVGSFGLTEATPGAGVQRVFRLNGAYDVDTTVGSTSTPGFSEYSLFYSNYRVWSADVKAEISGSTSGSPGAHGIVGYYPNATNTFLTNPSTWLVAPGAVTRTITIDGTGGRSIGTIVRRYDLPSVAHITRNQYKTDMDYSSTTTSIPGRQIQLAVFGVGSGSSSAASFVFTVWIAMDIEFFNPIQMST